MALSFIGVSLWLSLFAVFLTGGHSASTALSGSRAFRDLICYVCSGSSCPKKRYKIPIGHLTTSCQACYKEWDYHLNNATRKCFYYSNIAESAINASTDSCGIIRRGEKVSYYCFCYDDYCNHGGQTNNQMPCFLACLTMSLTLVSFELYYGKLWFDD